MKYLLVIAVVVTTFHAGITEDGQLFDCKNRPTQPCTHEGTCGSDGLCTGCADGYIAYDCHIEGEISTDPALCSGGCSDGACLTGGTCYCPPDKTGTNCETPTVKLTCGGDPPTDTDTMALDISALRGASDAQVIVNGADKGTAGDVECFGTSQTLSIKNILDAPTTTCPSAEKSTSSNGVDFYKREFLIRFYNGVTVLQTDLLVKAECGPAGPTIQMTSAITLKDAADENSVTKAVSRTNTIAGAEVTAKMEKPRGTALTAGQKMALSDEIVMTLTVDTTDNVFGAIDLKTCSVTNGESPPIEIELINDFCLTATAMIVFTTAPNKPTDNVIELTIKPVIIDPTRVNNYVFEILVCRDENKDACNGNCDARRKRSVEDKRNLASLHLGFNVVDTLVPTNSNARVKQDEKECVLSTEITASLVAMAVVILLLLVLVVVLVVRAIMAHRREVIVYEHKTLETGSTASLPKMINPSLSY